MFRKTIGRQLAGNNKKFNFRGHDVKRIEAFSDAVFAFAVTLLIVSLEVPKCFDELMVTMRGFFAFGVCFTLLMIIWYEQNIFFRRYGMHDIVTILLNCILMFLVLFYVYPLKFLFTLIFSDEIYGVGHSPLIMKLEDAPRLMLIYGLGYILIYLLFFFMYIHALRKKEELALTDIEVFDTRTKLYSKLLLIFIGVLAVLTSQAVPSKYSGMTGMMYMLIGPAFSVYHSYRGKKRRSLGIE